MTTPSINAHGTTTNGAAAGFSTTSTVTPLNLTTTQPNCLIVVWVCMENTSPAPAVTGVTATGLTFTKLTSFSRTAQAGPFATTANVIEVWTAQASSTFSGAITVTDTNGDVCEALAQAILYDGVSFPVVSSNVSIPKSGFADSGTSLPTVSGISTNGAALVLTCSFNAGGTAGGTDGCGPLLTAGSGYAIVNAGSAGNGSVAANAAVQSQQFASAQSSISSAFATTMQSWAALTLAFEAPGGGGPVFIPYNPWPLWAPILSQ